MPHKVPGVQTVDAAGASPAQQLSTSLHPTRAWFVTLADNSTLTAANLSKVFNTTDCDMADIRTCDLVPWIPHSTYITAVMWAPFPEHNLTLDSMKDTIVLYNREVMAVVKKTVTK